MKNFLRPFSEFSHAGGTRSGLFEDAQESFTDSFAYDRFQWPEFEIYGSARPSIVEFRTPAERAAEERGLRDGGEEGGDPAGDATRLYTTTNSDIPVYTIGEVVPVEGGVTPESSLSGPLIGTDDFRADARFAGIDGSGYGIVIIDGGIDLDDPFFGADANGDGISDRIVYQYDFADNDANASDVDGHGSNVASIAASSDGTYTGMAPGADIIALKVFSDSGSGYFSDIEESLQWVINNAEAYNIVSVNMSLGDTSNRSAPISLYGIGDELAVLASMNVVVVSASGNDFYSFNSVQGVSYPSADPNSLSIGAVYDGNTGGWQYGSGAIAYTTGADYIAPFSQRDDDLTTVFAPGAPITGAGAGAGLVTMHGTSQAAPHITGIIALAQELAVETLGRKLTYDEVESLLISSADLIVDGDNENDNVANTGLTFPRVNLVKLGEAILDMAPDEPSSFSIAAADAVKAEGDTITPFTFTVTRSGGIGEAASVDYAVSGGGADAADFYNGTLPGGTLNFAAGEAVKTVTVWIDGDSDFEPDESFTVTLGNPSGDGTIATASANGTILNDDAAPPASFFAIAASDAVKLEGDAGTTDFTFTVTRSGDTSGPGSVDYSLSGGADAADFAGGVLPGGSVIFAAGETSKTITVAVAGDAAFEGDEGFTVTLSNPSAGASIATAGADGIIVNDDAAPPAPLVLLAADFDSPGDTEGFVYRDGAFGGLTSQRYASGGWDDDALSVSLGGINSNFARDISGGWETSFSLDEAGEVTLSFLYDLNTGNDYETNEYTQVLVSIDGGTPILVDQLTGDGNGGPAIATGPQSFSALLGTLSAGSHSLVIGGYNNQKTWYLEQSSLVIDDVLVTVAPDGEATPPNPPVFSIAALDAVKAEGDSGSTAFTFTVTRGGDSTAAASVDYAVGGAVDATDFVGGLPAGTLSFAAGEVSKTLTLQVAGDTTAEGDEGFTVALANPSAGSAIDAASAEGSILNDDAAQPTAFFGIAALNAELTEGNSLTRHFTFTVTRSGDTSAAGSVDYAVSGDVDGADFLDGVLPSGTIEFAAGASSQTLLLLVHGDTAIESDEVFTVTLSNASAGSAITTASAQGTILNDDVTPPPGTFFSITALDAAKAEGDDGTTIFTFTVTREGDLSAPGSVEYRTTGGPSPTANAFDFLDDTLARGVLEFSAGEASRIVSVAVTGDDAFEGDENFFVHIENASAGSEITTASAAGVILNDDTTPTTIDIAAADAVKAEGDGGSTPFTFTVTRSGDVSDSDSVDYAVTGAQADVVDFVGSLMPAGTVTFNAGETSKTITIDVAGDSDVENDENFSVVLLNPAGGAVVTTGSAEGTILNDDAPDPGSFSIAARDTSRAEGDEGESTPFAFEITRTSDTAEAGSVYFEVTSSQADGSDFSNGVLHSGWINFPAGENFNVVTLGIWVAGDNIAEADETFTVTLSNPSAGFEIATASASATILNDDAAPPATLYEIAALDASKAEGDDGVTLFTFTISRSGDLTNPASIGYSLAGHGANPANSGDFASGLFVLSTATFAAGESSTTVSIRVAGDVNYEADEGFIVTIFDPSHGGAVVSGSDSATGTIANDDPVPITGSFSIAADDAVKAEGDSGITGLTFVVTRSGDSAAPASIDYAMTGGGADAGDFAANLLPAGTVSFAAGETSKTITVAVRGDVLVENDESFVITLSNPSPGSDITTATAVGTILNDDAPPPITYAISPLDAVKAEGDDDTTAFTFTVTRSDNISVFSSITYIVRGETADSADFPGFVLAQGTVNFAIGETSKTVSVNVDGDLSIEDDETFTVSLIDSGLEGVVIATESAQGTILNDDFVPASTLYSITAVDAVKAEGDSGATDFTFLISRTGDTSGGGAVNYRVRGDDIDVDDFGTSYLPGAGFNFLAGETSRLITIQVAGDSDIEGNEDFVVLLSTPSPDSGIEVGSASGTILDDDAPPSSFLAIAAADAVKAEGDSGSAAFTFTVTRSGDTSAAGAVDYAVSGAADGADFVGGLPAGTVTFAAGETSKTVTIEVAGDTDFEGDEAFTVTLSNASLGSEITTASAGGTILNDDAAPPATFLAIAAADAVKAEGDAGSTAFTFTVTRSGDTSAAGSVDYAVSGAADGADFAGGLPGGTVIFAAGETSRTITIEVAGDTDFEGDEAFTVTLSNSSGNSAITTAAAQGTILNDDAAPPTTFFAIAAEDAVQSEGLINETFLTFTVTRSGDTSAAGSVDYAVAGAVDGDDFVGGLLPAGTLSFAAGEVSRTLSFNVAGDGLEEPDEDFTVTLSNASAGAAITTATAEGTILNDDGLPPPPVDTYLTLSAADAVKSEGDGGSTIYSFLVSRSGTPIDDTSVDYTVVGSGDNPADAADFAGGVLPSGSVAIQGEGASAAWIHIAVAGDLAEEGDETFTVVLSNPSAGAAITTGSAQGSILNDDTPQTPDSVVLLQADFDAAGDTGGFAYVDAAFGGSFIQRYADGEWADGALTVSLGGTNNRIATDINGGWEADFTLAEAMDVTLSFDYALLISAGYEPDEYAQLLVSVDGGDAILVEELFGGGTLTSGDESASLDLGELAAGSHSIVIGGYNNKKSWGDEFTEISIDDVLVTGSAPAGGAGGPGLPPGGSPLDLSAGLSESELLSTAGF